MHIFTLFDGEMPTYGDTDTHSDIHKDRQTIYKNKFLESRIPKTCKCVENQKHNFNVNFNNIQPLKQQIT